MRLDTPKELSSLVSQFVGSVLFLHYTEVTPGVFADFNEKWVRMLEIDLTQVKNLPGDWQDSLRLEFAGKGLMPKWDELEERIYQAIERTVGEVGVLPAARFRPGRD